MTVLDVEPTDSTTAPNDFRWVTPDIVVSGGGSYERVPELVEQLHGRRVVAVTNRSVAESSPLLDDLSQRLGPTLVGSFAACREHSPSSSVDAVAETLARSQADVVIGVGGGSVCDAIKAATVSLAGPAGVIAHIAVPTTLSGAEFTIGIGVTDEDGGPKKVTTDPRAIPRAVVLDPSVTAWTPPRLWAATGVKAIDHAMEAIWCRRPHPLMTTLAAEGLQRLSQSLVASLDVEDVRARADCQIGAWMSIVRPGRSAIRLSHLLAHQVGACWGIPHGLTSAVLLPSVMRYLAPVTLDAQAVIARAMGVEPGDDAAGTAERAVVLLEEMLGRLDLPTRLRDVVGPDAVSQDVVAAAAFEEAEYLDSTYDLPLGRASVSRLLDLAW